MKKGFNSRKFLLAMAAMLGSIATSISGLVTDNPTVQTVGIICAVVSAAIYAAVEAYVDGKSISQTTITKTTTTTLTKDLQKEGTDVN